MEKNSVEIFAIIFWIFSSLSIALCLASLIYYSYVKSIKKFPFQACLFISGILYHITRMINWKSSFYVDFHHPRPPFDPYAFDFFGFAAYLLSGQILICVISIFNVNTFGRKLVARAQRQHMTFYVASVVHLLAHLTGALCQRFDADAKEYVFVPSMLIFGVVLSLMLGKSFLFSQTSLVQLQTCGFSFNAEESLLNQPLGKQYFPS